MGKMMRMILLVFVVVAMMSGSHKVEGRVAVAEQRKLTAAEDEGMDSGLQDNHHAYSIPDFNRQGGRAPTKY
ncbi:hypothetical protein SASPL_103474 [Salvia splendens]|uniref:Uncharacterized protein n=1 Tax=Salvia splendens TaxID=180675 RepID=A0A8X8YJR9_SALSN|nr:hypothetical protein SASPL_103474 [Salvia splendens]